MADLEEKPEGIEISNNSNEAISEIANETSTKNEVSAEIGEEPEPEEKPENGEIPKDGKKVPTAKYYQAFSNGALTTVDKLFELFWGLTLDDEVNTDGLKKINPEEFSENVILLAEQLELTQAEIKAWMGWLMVAGVIAAPYAKLTNKKVKQSKAIKKARSESKVTITNNEPVLSAGESIVEKVKIEQKSAIDNMQKKGLSKNWKLHPQPCDCEKCKTKRDEHGNIIEDAIIV